MSPEEKREVFAAITAKLPPKPTQQALDQTHYAIQRLIEVARRDTGQSRIVANFLLAWWNAEECGGFHLVELWAVDAEIAKDMVTVFAMLPSWQNYPDSIGYGKEFGELVRL